MHLLINRFSPLKPSVSTFLKDLRVSIFIVFLTVFTVEAIYLYKQHSEINFVMIKCGNFCALPTELLNSIRPRFGFKGSNCGQNIRRYTRFQML
jgi:hypothetical protein